MTTETIITILAIIVPALFAMGTYLLRQKGLDKAAAIIDAVSPAIVDALERAKQQKVMTGDYAKREAVKAAKQAVPAVARVLAGAKIEKLAADTIQAAYDGKKNLDAAKVKRIKDLSLSATTDGKKLGAEIKAGFKRGAVSVTGSGGRDGWRAGIGGKFKF